MAEFCLPPAVAQKFLQAYINDPDMKPGKLATISSAARRALFEKHLGADVSREVNTLFEEKLVMKKQQKAMQDWVNQLVGISQETKKELYQKIASMDKILDNKNKTEFLEDLTRKKLGIDITNVEAQDIFSKATVVEQMKTRWQNNQTDKNQSALGYAIVDLHKTINKYKADDRTKTQKGLDLAVQVLNIPRAIMASGDFSWPLRQGWGMMFTPEFRKGMVNTVRFFHDQKNIDEFEAMMLGDPEFAMMEKGGLAILREHGDVTKREESFQSSIPEEALEWVVHQTGVPLNYIKYSNRSFTWTGNFMRYTAAKRWFAAARLRGEDVRHGSEAVRQMMSDINTFSGRGNIGFRDKGANIAPILNAAFFSIRFNSAIVNMFNPTRWLNPNHSPTAKRETIKQLVGSLVITGTLLALAKAFGFEVPIDAQDANFGNYMTEANKFDPSGGTAKYMRLFARIAPDFMGGGREVSTYGNERFYDGKFGSPTRMETVFNFGRGLVAPGLPTILVDALMGKDGIGQEFNITDEIRKQMVPMTLGAYWDAYENDPEFRDVVGAVPSLFGGGMTTRALPIAYDSDSRLSVWGEVLGPLSSPTRTEVDNEMARIKYRPSMPAKTLKGVQLTEDQYRDLVKRSGDAAHQILEPLIKTEGWVSLTTKEKKEKAQQIVNQARDEVKKGIEAEDSGNGEGSIYERSQLKRYQRLEEKMKAGQ